MQVVRISGAKEKVLKIRSRESNHSVDQLSRPDLIIKSGYHELAQHQRLSY